MKVIKRAFGACETNCYIVRLGKEEFVIDPGVGSAEWVLSNTSQLKGILITHGHYDHVWDLYVLKSARPEVEVYCPAPDTFMLENDIFSLGQSPCPPDVKVESNNGKSSLTISETEVTYWHFPGHTPGCSMIELGGEYFSGDFIFKRGIGRYDFPYSSATQMKESLLRFKEMKRDGVVHPGHGESTFISDEQASVSSWLRRM